ncbi:MAG: protoporphyrinogen oxidase [Bradymonadia bacterium]
MKVAVIGGGLSGLACAWNLRRAGVDVVVLESDDRVGGKIKTERAEGYHVEWGPNGFLSSRESMVRLAESLDLGDQLISAKAESEKRYVMRSGRLEAVPGGPGDLLSTSILSVKGAARLLAEPLIPKRSSRDDESVYDFARRRMGSEAAVLMDAVVTGIYAGDPRRLSMKAAFPKIAQIESEHGSLLRGAAMMGVKKLRARRRGEGGPKKGRPKLTGFAGGMETLTGAMAHKLEDAIQVGRPVTGFKKVGRWRIEAGGGDPIEADAVVLATPTAAMARILAGVAPAAVAPLEAIPYAPAVVVGLGFPKAQMPGALDAFGYLVPSTEHRKILGGLFTSSIFPDRAPNGHVMTRSILGGARHPDLINLDDDALIHLVRGELSVALRGPMPEPTFARVIRWDSAIPQYVLGHQLRVSEVKSAVASLKGVYLAGNGLFGVGLPDCASRGEAVAEQIVKRM